MVRDRRRIDYSAAAARQFNEREDNCQMGRTLPRGGRRWFARSLLKPLSLSSQTAPAACAVVEALRRQRYTGKQIAIEADVSPATVSRILRRLGLKRLLALERASQCADIERKHPGELIHRRQKNR